MTNEIFVYCLKSHITGGSVHDLVSSPLGKYARISVNEWFGEPSEIKHSDRSQILFFNQLPPPLEILDLPGIRVLWAPMWDHARGLSHEWWSELPKHLRIVAFSNVVANKARTLGLPFLHLTYYKNPAKFPISSWGTRRTMFYWNRNGFIGPRDLMRLCDLLEIDQLLYRKQIDPRIPLRAEYNLPSQFNNTIVTEIGSFISRQEYYAMLQKINVYIAPRAYEGVGLTFLEAMASGCAVLGNDAPTMNEYIHHGKDGYLFNSGPNQIGWLEIFSTKSYRKLLKIRNPHRTFYDYFLYKKQDWDALRSIDLCEMGILARAHHENGYLAWQRQIESYAKFVLD